MNQEIENLRAENARLRARVTELEAATCERKTAPAGSPLSIVQEISDNQLQVQKAANTVWTGSHFESIQQLRPDFSGKVGELAFNRLCREAGLAVTYTGDANIDADDGTYDCKIGVAEKKDEVKTAWRGSNGTFQHESLRAGGCDQTVFIDISPNDYYITILPKFDMTKKHDIIGRTPHLRRGTSDVYKFDMGVCNLDRAVAVGSSIKVDVKTTMAQVATFLKKFH